MVNVFVRLDFLQLEEAIKNQNALPMNLMQ